MVATGGCQASKSKKKPVVNIKPVARIPSSRADSSSNWKALLQKQGKSLPAPSAKVRPHPDKSAMDKDVKRFRNSEGSGSDSRSVSTERSRSISESRCPSQLSMASEAPSSIGTDNFDTESEAGSTVIVNDPSLKVKQEFRALGLSESKRQSRGSERGHRGTAPRRIAKKPPPEGLNEFGYFDYTHYGVLRTPITPAHAEFMEDSGIIAMDCEMVGVGPMKESALARVSIVNEYGYCLYDRFVKPKCEVTDYRTQFSGIRENDLKNAIPFQIVAKEVADLLKGHILVGHSLKSDLAVLFLSHPKAKTRDTAFFFKRFLHCKTPKLKMLVKKLLGVEIQQGEHSSITDAQATMALYQLYQKEWEIQARQMNRGIDAFKEALDNFKTLKTSSPSSQSSIQNINNNNNNQKNCINSSTTSSPSSLYGSYSTNDDSRLQIPSMFSSRV